MIDREPGPDPGDDVTRLLDQARAGCPDAAGKAVERVYDALRNQARLLLSRERAGHTLQPTALVNEALIKVLQGHVAGHLENSRQFVEVATAFMRYVLVSHARTRKAARRGGGRVPMPLDESIDQAARESGGDAEELLEAIEQFTARHPRAGQVVTLRSFFNLTMPEIAERLGVSLSTVEGDFRLARAWLRRALDSEASR